MEPRPPNVCDPVQVPNDHSPQDWDARYDEEAQIWSGNPNQVLVDEVAALSPGTALDVGCGEGADAIWLARQGWAVTAIDISKVALNRARAAAEQVEIDIDWQEGSIEQVEGLTFDLVAASYLPLHKEGPGLAHLLEAVAPGGTLFVVHHAEFDPERAKAHGFDPADYLTVDEIAADLGPGWEVGVHERRGREISGGAGAHHHEDVVLRARWVG